MVVQRSKLFVQEAVDLNTADMEFVSIVSWRITGHAGSVPNMVDTQSSHMNDYMSSLLHI